MNIASLASPPPLIDTHCHLDAPCLAARLAAVIAAATAAGVIGFIVPGVAPENWDRVAAIAGRAPSAHPAFGLHPMHAHRLTPALLKRLGQFAARGVAIGEIGLDYSYRHIPRAIQQDAFRQQLRLAVQAGRPVLLHCRRAFQDLLQILREEGVHRVGGVMHAFSGSPETARECIRLGLLISVAGPVTFANSVRPRRVAQEIPLDYLLVETDAPDLAPEPFRGQDNEPAFLPAIAEQVATLKGVSYAEVAAATTANARRLFAI